MDDPILTNKQNFPGHTETLQSPEHLEGQAPSDFRSCPPGEDPIYFAKKIAQMNFAANQDQINLQDYDVGKLVLQKHSSSNMMAAEMTCDQIPGVDGLMRFNSGSFWNHTRPELSRHSSEQAKNQASVHENYAELIGPDADNLTAKLNQASVLRQLSLKKKEEYFAEDKAEVPVEIKESEKEEVASNGLLSPNTTKSLFQKEKSKRSFAFGSDLEANKIQSDSLSPQDYDPIEEVADQDVIFTTQNGNEIIITQNENVNLVITKEVPHSLIPFSEIKLDFEEAYGPETKIYLTKVAGFFTALMLISGSVLLTTDDTISFERIIMIAAGYFAFLLIIDIFWTLSTIGELVLASDSIFKIYDALSYLFSIFIIYLKLSNFLSSSIFASLPLLVTTLVYFYQSTSQQKTLGTLVRAYLTVQTLLITLKLDGLIDKEWSSVLMLSWAFAIASVFYSLNCLFLLSQKIMKTHIIQQRARQTINLDNNKRLGFAWHSLYYGSSLLAPFVLFGVIKAFSQARDFEVLHVAAYMSFAVGGILVATTLLFRKSLVNFIISFGLINNEESEVNQIKLQQVDSEQTTGR